MKFPKTVFRYLNSKRNRFGRQLPEDWSSLPLNQIMYRCHCALQICQLVVSQLLAVDGVTGARVGLNHDDQTPSVSGHVGHLDHGDDVSRQLVQNEEQNLRGLLGLVLELDHFWDPVRLLRVVVGDALRFEVRNGHVLSPRRWVTRAAQENVVSR